MGLITGGLRPEFSCAGTEKWGENGDYKCLKSVLTKKKGSIETWLLGQSEAEYYAKSVTSIARITVTDSRSDLQAVNKYFED